MSKHVELFVQADIDFLLFDTTNAFTYPDVAISLMEVLEDGRKQGFKVPQIGYFTNSYAGETAQRIYEEIYKKMCIRICGIVLTESRYLLLMKENALLK